MVSCQSLVTMITIHYFVRLCLAQTFVATFDFNILISNYTVFCKLSKQGWRSGGLVCMIRTCFIHFVKHNSDNDLF